MTTYGLALPYVSGEGERSPDIGAETAGEQQQQQTGAEQQHQRKVEQDEQRPPAPPEQHVGTEISQSEQAGEEGVQKDREVVREARGVSHTAEKTADGDAKTKTEQEARGGGGGQEDLVHEVVAQ